MMLMFACAICLWRLPISAFAGTENFSTSEQTLSYGDVNISRDIEQKIYLDMYSRYPESNEIKQIETIKALNDMNGRTYYVVEFFSCGYTIYDESFGCMLEMSKDALSPYKDKSGNLIYLGAFNYYYGDQLSRSVVSGDKITHCEEGKELVLNKENLDSISRFVNDINEKIENSKRLQQTRGVGTVVNETASISNEDIIKTADTTGFNTSDDADTKGFNKGKEDTGKCGYVAAALLIFYASKAWNWTYLYGQDTIQKSLVEEIQGTRNGSSWAPDVEGALNEYMAKKGATHNPKVNMWNVPSNHTFFDRVREDKPCAMFANMVDPLSQTGERMDHVVVVYKVTRIAKEGLFGIRTYSNYEYTAHCGWAPKYTVDDEDIDCNSKIFSDSSTKIGGLVNLHK